MLVLPEDVFTVKRRCIKLMVFVISAICCFYYVSSKLLKKRPRMEQKPDDSKMKNTLPIIIVSQLFCCLMCPLALTTVNICICLFGLLHCVHFGFGGQPVRKG